MEHHLQHISDLALCCKQFGVVHVVIAPGSRNAPLIQAFTSMESIACHSIPDERVAGYFALGLALETQNPVALICTSGTATLNLAPAVAEAFYQHVPLIILTADRPGDVVETQQNQTIPQQEIFSGFIKGSMSLPNCSLISALPGLLTLSTNPHPGPVHINIPTREPLYESLPSPIYCDAVFTGPSGYSSAVPEELEMLVKKSQRIVVLCGQHAPNQWIRNVLQAIADSEKAVVVAEAIANVSGESTFTCTDTLAAWIDGAREEDFLPDLLISTGGHIVSKRWLLWLQKHPEMQHWRIAEAPDQIDTYGNLKGIVAGNPELLLSNLFIHKEKANQHFLQTWKSLNANLSSITEATIAMSDFSDFTVFYTLLHHLPANCNLHLGNGSVVRYAQLFDIHESITVYSNRGVSGIDGSISTAAGISKANPGTKNILLIGDMSFVYDSNALWNRSFPQNLIIIVINNSGGGIFRLMEGPSKHPWFEGYQVAHHPAKIEKIAAAFEVEYRQWDSITQISHEMDELFLFEKSLIIEIKTPVGQSERIFKSYYEKIKN